jgi:hypothetical protein
MKMAAFWDVASTSLVEVYRRFRDAMNHHSDHSDSKHSRNTVKLLLDYTAQQPRRRPLINKSCGSCRKIVCMLNAVELLTSVEQLFPLHGVVRWLDRADGLNLPPC